MQTFNELLNFQVIQKSNPEYSGHYFLGIIFQKLHDRKFSIELVDSWPYVIDNLDNPFISIDLYFFNIFFMNRSLYRILDKLGVICT